MIDLHKSEHSFICIGDEPKSGLARYLGDAYNPGMCLLASGVMIHDLRKQVCVHHDKVAGASCHNKQMKNFVTSEIFMPVIEDREF